VTTLNGRTQLNFPTTDAAPFASLGAPYLDNIQSRFEGQFFAPVSGTYEFGTTSDDGSILFIDGVSVVYNNRFQGMTRRNGTITLSAGLHTIEVGHYEGGGGAGLIVDVTKPGGTNQILGNSDLYLSTIVPTFDNVITATASGGTINVIAPRAIAQDVVVPNGTSFGASGNRLTVAALNLTGATTSTFNIANETTVLQVTDGGGAVGIVKNGTGDLVFDEPAVPQFTNAGSSITVNQGAVGLVLGGALSPTGAANIIFNGGGVVLSSKTGANVSYNTPNFTNGGVIGARVIGSGVAGTVGTPIQVTMNGGLQVGAGNTLKVSTANYYELNVGGTASGSGTVAIGTGVVNSTTNTALQGLNILMNPLSGADPAILRLKTNSPTVKSLTTSGGGTSQIIVGNGLAPATLTITGPDSPNVTRFAGAITENGGQPVTVNANGTGTLVLGGVSAFTGGVSVGPGTLELANNSAAGTGPITLGGGTLQFSNPGLLLKLYNSNPGNSGAYTAGVLNSTFANVLSHFAAIGTPAVITTTAANGNPAINYPSDANANPGNRDGAPFAVHGFGSVDNIEALFTGKFDAGAGGTFRFSPRSDDGTTIYIDGVLLVNNNFPQGVDENNQATRDQNIVLSPGLHDIAFTFNEGGGGAGMFVDYTPPGGVRQLLLNGNASAPTLSTNEYFKSSNPVNVTASSTLNLRNGTVELGVLTQLAGTTITTTPGLVTFSEAILPTNGVYSITGAGDVVFKQITDGGNNVTVNRSGGGSLILGVPVFGQMTGTSAFNISGGSSLVAVSDGFTNPLGNATVSLTSGAALKLSSSGGDVNFGNTVSLNGNASIAAGNFGGGAINGPVTATLLSPVTVGAGNTLTASSSNNYTLDFGAGIVGAGNVQATGGNVVADGNIAIGGNLGVTGGTLRANQNTTANQIDISNSTLTAGPSIVTNAGTNVGSKGNLELNSTLINGPVSVNGGRILAATGVNDLTPVALSIAATSATSNPDKLRASLYMATNLGINNDNGVNQTIPSSNPNVAIDLTLPLNNPQGPNADANFTALFGGALPGSAPFTAVATGYYTANATGTHQFNINGNDDRAVFWLDLNHNGILEVNGSAGNERLVDLGCCGGNAPTNVTLVGGEKYKVFIAVEDTGGDSGLVARFTQNGGIDSIVEPGAPGQAGIWSYDTVTGGGKLEVAPFAQINASVVNNGRIKVGASGTFNATRLVNNEGIELVGGFTPGSESSLTLTAGVATNSNADSLTVSGGSGTGAILNLNANSTLTTTYLALSPNGRLIKQGGGTLTTLNQTLGAGSTLEITDGKVNLRGNTFASNQSTNNGAVLVDGANSTLNLIRAINGDVTLDNDGTLQAAGSFTYAPALNLGVGGGVVDTEGFNITVTGGVNGAGAELTKIDNGTLALAGVINLDTLTANGGTTSVHSSVTLTALNIGAGATVVLDAAPPAAPFESPIVAESGGQGAFEDPGAAASQAAIPEPGSVGLLLVGTLGLLARRRRA
jgi:autotransporter-associated beta strand protein